MPPEIPFADENNTRKMNLFTRIRRIMFRRKDFDVPDQHEPGKICSYLDLISIGVITSLGFGVFALHGHITSEMSGPSTLVSYAIVAIIGLIVALCYIEFNFRIPIKAGSSYNFISTVLCEIVRFIIGWNLILEYIIAAACASRSFSLHLDTLLNNTLADTFTDVASMNTDVFAGYFDFLAFAMPIVITIAIAIGLKRYRIQTTIITVINLIFLWFIVIAGIVRARTANWKVPAVLDVNLKLDPNIMEGGFMPFTITGTMQAASVCIIVFLGFDSLTHTFNRETIQQAPRKVPLTILLSFGVISVMYISISTTLTLMFPYHLQNANAWIPYAFVSFGWDYAKYLGAIGGMICLLTSLYLFLYSIIPLIKQMAHDGLIFEKFGAVTNKSYTPVLGILSCGVLSALLSGFFETRQLLNALSLGTLLLFLGITVSVIILRYSSSLTNQKTKTTFGMVALQLCNAKCKSVPSNLTAKIVEYLVAFYCLASLGLSLILATSHKDVFVGETWAVVLASVFLFLMLLFIIGIAVQPKEPQKHVTYKVPLVPLLPGLAIFMIIYLITRLHYGNWIRFGIWTIIGLVAYFWGIYVRDRGVKNKSVITPSVSSKELIVQENGTNDVKKVGTIKLRQEPEPERYEETKPVASAPPVSNSPELCRKEVVAPTVIAAKSSEDINSLHSSTKSYDEIHSINELQDNLKEKKEPNGNVYFVEENEKENKSDSSGKSSPKQDTETRNAIAFLDDIIQDEEKRPPSVNFEQNVIAPAISTEAVVHRADSIKEPVTVEEAPKTFYIPPPPPLPPPVQRQDSDSDDNSEEHAEKRAFKKRLNTIYAGKSNGQTKPIKKPDNERPVLQHSHSDSDLNNMMEYESNLNQDASISNPAIAHELGVINIPQAPKFDAALFAEIGKKYDKPVKPDPESPIPEPPAFDPVLYNSLGRKSKKLTTVEFNEVSTLTKPPSPKVETTETQQSIPAEIKARRYSPKPQPKALLVAPEPPPTDNDALDRQTIKQKLELIFQRGPPNKMPLAKPKPDPKPVEEPPPAQKPNHPAGERASDDDDKEMNITDTSAISGKKPYDTVKLQKIRFENVLKLIKDETKPSIIRNNSLQRNASNRSTASSEIHTNDLNHVAPLKKYLPDT